MFYQVSFEGRNLPVVSVIVSQWQREGKCQLYSTTFSIIPCVIRQDRTNF
uniref:Uncharacterized protein n=1 Tax=Anguilla anguilla TaxID=7936 RepID=A0A0E9SKK7_ANGAN